MSGAAIARITEAMRDAAANILAQADGCQYVFAKHYDLANMVLAAALSTEPGEAEGQTVEISRTGWEEDEGERKFTATAVFKEPPNWPFNVVWKRIPVRMTLAAPLPEGTHHGR